MVRPPTVVLSRVAGLREAIQARGLTGDWIRWVSEPTPEALAGAEVLVGEPAVCAPVVEHCPNLKWLQSTFAGCNPMLNQPRKDFAVTRLAGCFGPDMAEYCFLHILALERQYDLQRKLQHEKQWLGARNAESGDRQGGAAYRRLSSLTLGILGLGDIGSCIAARATNGLGMRVIGWRRDGTPRDSDVLAGVTEVFGGQERLASFLSQADYLVSVLPSTPQTRGLLDGDALAACAARVPALINVGRGDLLNEESIITALDRAHLSHYVGDVFVPEPLAESSALWNHPKVTVTPHNSAVTQPEDVASAFADNLERYEAGGAAALQHVFDWKSGY